ncbi:unnamed protein product [Ranitomeya imitator]|uniref:Uncharacterized protein n=1 Tax=Ranitomeya imitator TaxID=111125 RepID=A0ABN9LXA6_9NEOB|nr:unnamed protein product [Ranitomeya imitator]
MDGNKALECSEVAAISPDLNTIEYLCRDLGRRCLQISETWSSLRKKSGPKFQLRKFELASQIANKPTILFNPPSKEMQKALNIVQTNYRSAATTNPPSLVAAETSPHPGRLPDRRKRLLSQENSPEPAKKLHVTTIELPDGDDDDDDDKAVEVDDGDVIIMEEVSTPKPKSDKTPENGTGLSPIPMDSLEGVPSGMTAATTQTDKPEITVKKEEDDGNFQGCQEMSDEKEYYKKHCEELSIKLKNLGETIAQQMKKETSHQQTQTLPSSGDVKYEHALKEISRLNLMCKKLQELKSESGCSPIIEVDSTSEVDDMALQLDGIFRKLDTCRKRSIERLQQEKKKLEAENKQLKMEIQQLKEAANESSASISELGEERTKLRMLRIHVAQLLTTLMPDLDLEQVDYDVDVIDEILVQVLEQAEKQANGHE